MATVAAAPPDPASVFGPTPQNELPVTTTEINWLLRVTNMFNDNADIHPVSSLTECKSSFFVLLFENVFHVPLPEKEEELRSNTQAKINNLRRVIECIEAIIQFSLRHIEPERIVLQQDPLHISRLLRVFLNLVRTYQIGVWNLTDVLPVASGRGELDEEDDGPGGPVELDETGFSGDDDEGDEGATAPGGHLPRQRPASHHVTNWVQDVVPPMSQRDALLYHMARVAAKYGAVDEDDGVGRTAENAAVAAGNPGHRQGAAARAAPGGAPSAADTSGSKQRTSAFATTKPLRRTPGQRSLNAALRDTKIERLRAQRFLEAAEREALIIASRGMNAKEVALRTTVRKDLRNALRDAIDRRRQLKDEDEVFRRVYADVLVSEATAAEAANTTTSTLASGALRHSHSARSKSARHCVEQQLAELQAAQAEAEALRRSQTQSLYRDLDRFQHGVTGWRRAVPRSVLQFA